MAVTRSRRDVLNLGYGTAATLGVSALTSAGALGPVRALAQGAPAVHAPAEDFFYRDDWFGEPWRKPEAAVLIHGNEESSLVWYAWMPRMGRAARSAWVGSVADPRGLRVVAAEPCRLRGACHGQGGRRYRSHRRRQSRRRDRHAVRCGLPGAHPHAFGCSCAGGDG